MSGRSLRRLPVLAQARNTGMFAIPPPGTSRSGQSSSDKSKRRVYFGPSTQVEILLEAMERVVDAQTLERGRLAH